MPTRCLKAISRIPWMSNRCPKAILRIPCMTCPHWTSRWMSRLCKLRVHVCKLIAQVDCPLCRLVAHVRVMLLGPSN
jgi:hypothetical protein